MAASVPVVACAAGGHLETVGPPAEAATFPAGDAAAAAAHLVRLADKPDARRAEGARLRARQQRIFSLDRHIAALDELYRSLIRQRSR
jgi:glycosyltransferase involved in cell wall biosynthesis